MGVVAGLIGLFECLSTRHLVNGQTRLQRHHAFAFFLRQLQERLADKSARAHQRGVHAQLFDTTRQRCGLAVDAAEEDQIGVFTADGGQHGAEVHRFVINVLTIDNLHALRFKRFNKLVRQSLTKGGTVVDHRNAFGFQRIDRVLTG